MDIAHPNPDADRQIVRNDIENKAIFDEEELFEIACNLKRTILLFLQVIVGGRHQKEAMLNCGEIDGTN